MALEVTVTKQNFWESKAEKSQGYLDLSVGGRQDCDQNNISPESMKIKEGLERKKCSVEDDSEAFNFNDWVKEQKKTICEIAESWTVLHFGH